MNAQLKSQFGGQTATAKQLFNTASTPVGTFIDESVALVCCQDGVIYKHVKQANDTVSYKLTIGQSILCCDYANKLLALGTNTGIYTLDMTGQLQKVGNYSLPVSQIQFVNGVLIALILDSPSNAQPRYVDGDLVFALVRVRTSDHQIVAEASDLRCHGCFGVSMTGQIQVLGAPDLLVTFDENLQKVRQNLITQSSATPLCGLVPDEALVYESGLVNFIRHNKQIEFEQRVNQVEEIDSSHFLLALQNGTVVLIEFDDQHNIQYPQVVFNANASMNGMQGTQEVVCMQAHPGQGKPWAIGVGSIQQSGPGQIVIGTLMNNASKWSF